MDFIKRTWAEIDLNALESNINHIKEKISGGAKLMGVVKGDGYGHGDIVAAKMYEKLGACSLAVASLTEAIGLRREGLTKPILILGFTSPEYVPLLLEHRITQTIVGMEHAKHLQDAAEKCGAVLQCNIALDTGMSRIGFSTMDEDFEESKAQILEVSKMPNLKITGTFTHFAVSDTYIDDNTEFTKKQFARFCRMTDALTEAGMDVGLRHCANSAAIISYPEMHLDMCRAGVITYGIIPSPECVGKIELEHIMTLKTMVGLVKHIKAGAQVSYGRTFTAEKDMTIAVVPIGYTDGYFRNLSNQGRMLVHGQYAPVIGRVCMDQCMLDVTGIADVKEGDEVVVFGHQGDGFIPAEESAELLGTIAHEVTNVVGKRVPRVFMKDGKVLGVVDYILQRFEYNID